jgi:hypothetical protein
MINCKFSWWNWHEGRRENMDNDTDSSGKIKWLIRRLATVASMLARKLIMRLPSRLTNTVGYLSIQKNNQKIIY